jgi:hypothetical protein
MAHPVRWIAVPERFVPPLNSRTARVGLGFGGLRGACTFGRGTRARGASTGANPSLLFLPRYRWREDTYRGIERRQTWRFTPPRGLRVSVRFAEVVCAGRAKRSGKGSVPAAVWGSRIGRIGVRARRDPLSGRQGDSHRVFVELAGFPAGDEVQPETSKSPLESGLETISGIRIPAVNGRPRIRLRRTRPVNGPIRPLAHGCP